MSRIAPMGAVAQKVVPAGKDPEWMARVAAMHCVICWEWGLTQNSRTQVHHCFSGRYSSEKSCDRKTIPLCEGHHQGLRDTSKLAIHQDKRAWEAQYGPDTDWLSWVEARIEEGPQ